MSHNVIEADDFPATIPVTDVDDTTYPTTEADMGQRLANRTRHLLNSISWNFGATDSASMTVEPEELLSSIPHPETRLGTLNFFSQIAKPVVRSFRWMTERLPGMSATPKIVFLGINPLNEGDAAWKYSPIVSGVAGLMQRTVTGSEEAHFDLPVPQAGFLRNVTVWARPLTGVTHAALPGTMPTVQVYHISSQVSGLAKTEVGVTTDPSANTTVYDALHSIPLTLSHAMVQSLSTGALLGYRIRVTGESGANAVQDGFGIAAITATFARGGG